MAPLFLHQRFKIFNVKFIYILSWLLLFIKYSFGQVVPQGLIHNKAYTETSIFADAQFRLYYNTNGGQNTKPNPSIKSDFSFNFSNNTPYTFQFQYSVYSEALYNEHEFEIPLIGFTNKSSLDTATAIILYSFKSWVTRNTIGSFLRKDDKIVQYVLNSNKDLSKNLIGTTNPVNNLSSGVITTVYNGQSWKNYKNGILVNEIINTTIWNGSGNLIIGNGTRNYKHDVLNLFYDEIRFWNRALSQDEITNNWNKPLKGDETGLQVYYNFNHQGYPSYLRWNNNYHHEPSFDFYNRNVTYLNDLSPNKFKGRFINCELHGFTNNFYRMTSDTYNYNFDSLIFHFDAINVDSYPGSGKYNNTPSVGQWYNLYGFNNNFKFYTSTDYYQFVQPIYNLETNNTRSFYIDNFYGKSDYNTDIFGNMDIAMEAWIKFNTNNNYSIVKLGENYERKKIEIGVTVNKFSVNIGTTHPLLSNTSLISNKWYHLIITYSKNTNKFKIFINGLLDIEDWIDPRNLNYVIRGGVIEPVPNNITNTPLYIGTIESPFNGKIALLKLYKRSLNNTEIIQKFNATKSRFGY